MSFAAFYPTAAADMPALDAWSRYRQLRLRYRASSLHMRTLRAGLGAAFARKRAELARPGCEGAFHAWLRSHNIPRSTAYGLIRFALRPASAPKPSAELANCRLTIRLDRKDALVARRALLARTAPGAPSFSLAELIARVATAYSFGELRPEMDRLWARDPNSFSPERAAALAFRIP